MGLELGRGKSEIPNQIAKKEIDFSPPGNSNSGTRGNVEQHEVVDVDVNQVEFLSPDSPPSSGFSKGVDVDSRDPGSSYDVHLQPLSPQVGMTTSTMVTAPASAPVSRPLPPPMVTMSMPLPVTLPAQGSTPAIQMPWDQLFSQQVAQPVANLVTSAPGAPPQLMTVPLASQAPQAAFPNANAQMRPDSSRNYSPYTPLNRYPCYSRNAPLHATSGAAVHSSPTSWRIPAEYLLSTSPSQPSRNV
ncbi:verprolin-like [Spinacia oleracea]|uniref:Verprolin-like n=1 Tax=Spinacia oleracea TaxID=3562 RepID=A0ABM3QYQ7_SPIOL|nr:verprolin-like [Spinacia oleracea]